MEEDDNKFKITCQRWNGFVTCSGWGGELLYISFLRDEISTLLIHPEEIVIENYYFQWPVRKIMQHIYQKILKEVNGNHKYLSCSCI